MPGQKLLLEKINFYYYCFLFYVAVLPQLRSVTAQELGCSEAGYSLAGQSIHNWYCVIVAGKPSLELNQARAVRTPNYL